MNFVRILQIYILLLATHIRMTECGYISRMFNVIPSHFITSFKEVLTAPSAFSCVGQCISRYRCGTSAYKTATKQCFLYAHSQTRENPIADDVTVYAQHPWPPCDPASAAAAGDPVTTEVTWDRSGWEGKVTCKADYIYSRNSSTILCSPAGLWLNDGLCRQSVWTNVPATMDTFIFPRAPQVGWAMCLQLTTCTSCRQLKCDLSDAKNNSLFHMAIRSSATGTLDRLVTTTYINKVWASEVLAPNSPFVQNHSFALEFRLQDAHHLDILVDGSVIMHHTSSISFTTLTNFYLWRMNSDASLQRLSLSSGC